jgi:hypothetical protein
MRKTDNRQQPCCYSALAAGQERIQIQSPDRLSRRRRRAIASPARQRSGRPSIPVHSPESWNDSAPELCNKKALKDQRSFFVTNAPSRPAMDFGLQAIRRNDELNRVPTGRDSCDSGPDNIRSIAISNQCYPPLFPSHRRYPECAFPIQDAVFAACYRGLSEQT